jgi:hypothetical protein
MLCTSQEVYQELRKTAAISTSSKLYAVCKIPLKIEVKQDTIEISVFMDEYYGTVLQCILKESKEYEDVTYHVIKVVQVRSQRTTPEPFDIADSVLPDLAVAVSEVQYSTQSTIQTHYGTPSTGPRSSTHLPMEFGIPGMYCSGCEERED